MCPQANLMEAVLQLRLHLPGVLLTTTVSLYNSGFLTGEKKSFTLSVVILACDLSSEKWARSVFKVLLITETLIKPWIQETLTANKLTSPFYVHVFMCVCTCMWTMYVHVWRREKSIRQQGAGIWTLMVEQYLLLTAQPSFHNCPLQLLLCGVYVRCLNWSSPAFLMQGLSLKRKLDYWVPGCSLTQPPHVLQYLLFAQVQLDLSSVPQGFMTNYLPPGPSP